MITCILLSNMANLPHRCGNTKIVKKVKPCWTAFQPAMVNPFQQVPRTNTCDFQKHSWLTYSSPHKRLGKVGIELHIQPVGVKMWNLMFIKNLAWNNAADCLLRLDSFKFNIWNLNGFDRSMCAGRPARACWHACPTTACFGGQYAQLSTLRVLILIQTCKLVWWRENNCTSSIFRQGQRP